MTATLELLPMAGIACETDTGIKTLPLSSEPSFAYWQQDIPSEYWHLGADELKARVAEARRKLGQRLIVLGHHYQREDIIQFADFRGDSFNLARWAAGHPESEYIVFCGVHFMAEAADILSAPHQKVMLPNMAAGCSMADMADPEDVYACWSELGRGRREPGHTGHIHELGGVAEGLLRQARRHRLHFEQRRRRPALGLRARR